VIYVNLLDALNDLQSEEPHKKEQSSVCIDITDNGDDDDTLSEITPSNNETGFARDTFT
jgi:hypothetical protein